jgi:hypothetical protein
MYRTNTRLPITDVDRNRFRHACALANNRGEGKNWCYEYERSALAAVFVVNTVDMVDVCEIPCGIAWANGDQ